MRTIRLLICCGALLGGSCLTCAAVQAQATTAPGAIDPDQGKMGPYRALAHLAYQSYEKKDNSTAAILARILEKSWDRGEGDLRKSSPDVWSKIDSSMDGFVKPLTRFAQTGRADEAKERAAYEQYLANLSAAD